MHFGARSRLLTSWIICLVILAGSFVPAALQHLIKVDSDVTLSNWVQVCTLNGTRYVSVGQSAGSSAPTDPQTHHVSGHCPWCSAYTAVMGMPPSPPTIWLAPVQGHVLPLLFLSAPTPLFAWIISQPRGPPLLA